MRGSTTIAGPSPARGKQSRERLAAGTTGTLPSVPGETASTGSADNRSFLGAPPPPDEDVEQKARPGPLGARTLTVPETLGRGFSGRRAKLEGA